MSEPVSREEFIRAVDALDRRITSNEDRITQLDQVGTRGVALVGLQVQELAKDVATLGKDIELHEERHEQERRERAAGRRWLIGAAIAVAGAVDVPTLLSLVLYRH